MKLWNTAKNQAENLSKSGITALWLPPAYKGIGGKDEVGYGPYDLYDLGEFYQKNTLETKYGSKSEYIEAIKVLQQNNIEVYADIVLNHKMGADKSQIIKAIEYDWKNHNQQIGDEQTVKVPTKFIFEKRKNKYSDFEWNWTDFDGIDYDENTKQNMILKFKNKEWDSEVDGEFGNYDYLMGADLDFTNQEVIEECKDWGKWYVEITGADGFRLDAVKHISATFYKEWIQYLRDKTKKQLFSVGEYWSYDINKLHQYIQKTEGKISLFDVPLHANFYNASKDTNFDMGAILNNTLVKENPSMAVTFVDNHDTQPGQALESFIEPWFKPIAYSIILLREEGYPCVFYGDYYGIPHNDIVPMEQLETLLLLRKERAYGKENNYFDHKNVIGWTREGDEEHLQSGLAVIVSNDFEAEKRMYIGKEFDGERFIDALDNCESEVVIDEDGFGIFKCKSKSVSVWVKV